MRLLVIESDLILLALLLDTLPKGYHLDVASNCSKAKSLLSKRHFQGILGDWTVLENFWLDFKQSLLKKPLIPPLLIFLDEHELGPRCQKLRNCLAVGLHKPFSLEDVQSYLEFFANKQALLNNFALMDSQRPSLNNQRPSQEELVLIASQRQVQYFDQAIFLTDKEFALLDIFIKRAKLVISKSVLANLIWGDEESIFNNTIEQHISSLRRKLKQLTKQALIVTVRGNGYYWQGLR